MRLSLEVRLTPQQIAQAFADMDDEQQAQFFVEVAAIAATWERDPSAYQGRQWFSVGKHLATCSCSTDAARALVAEVHEGLTAYQAQPEGGGT